MQVTTPVLRQGPRLLHPLMGSNLATLLRVLAKNRPIPLAGSAPVALALGAALLRWPFSTAERWIVSALRPRGSAVPPPIFIVGHWRSGTTHLYNLLSRASGFAYVDPVATALPWDFLGLARLVRPLLERALPADRFIDRVQVRPDSPQEDEIALANMQTLSFYHALYFPRRFSENLSTGLFFDGCSDTEIEQWKRAIQYFVQKLHLQQSDERLLIKNPVYTARLALLDAMWPGAKFIHIYRNPFVVFQSTRNFYRSLFQEFALQPFDGVDLDRAILDSYPRMLDALFQDAAALAPDQFVEVRFEEFEANPLAEAARIYDTLGLDGFPDAQPGFEAYLQSVEGYRKNRYSYPHEDEYLVRRHWGAYVERWHYESPG